jgi:hypothetical protein
MESSQKYKNKDWLYDHYIVKKLSTYQIGELVSRDSKTIYNHLKKFNILTRTRGENLSKKGNDNYMKHCKKNPFEGKNHSEKTKEILRIKSSRSRPDLRGKKNGMYGKKGKLNPNYKDGSSRERQLIYASSRWKKIVRRTFKRDNYLCQRCSGRSEYKNPLHSHHLRSWANNLKSRFDINNLVTLCKKCHNFVHSKKNINKDFII